MSREKQIEEMAAITAKLLDMDCEETPFFAESNGFCELFDDCGVCKGARLLLNAGYRKQSDVAREIFEEIEKYECHDLSGKTIAYMLYAKDFAELKMKYTEGET